MARARKRKSSRPARTSLRRRAGRPPQQGRRPGRPPVHDEAWTKVTWCSSTARSCSSTGSPRTSARRSGAAISRAQLIRALLDAVADADIDLTSATSEADLKATILARLGRYRLGGGPTS